ncbi:MAG: AAA family ATPase [Dehalococcoidia bacterium]|jgi:DNA repair exonuclease SbcCD ATPase subunit
MRYVRLRIANYRGVSEREAEFAGTGITLVRGPNEIGKTSLGEAVWILFGYADSSKHSDLMAIRPVHRDEGTEIELEAESGPYQFTYFKRYFKKPETRLTITKPKAESLTGRRAHERADAILRGTLDVNLWKALSIRQGAEIKQPKLTEQTWLSQALDRAAGGHSTDPKAESLFEAVHAEYSNYFTPGGAEKKELEECRQALSDCQSEVQKFEEALRDLEHDIDRASDLRRELGELEYSEQTIANELENRSDKLKQITELDQRLSEARLNLQVAKVSEKAARADKRAREELVNKVSDATKAEAEMGKSTDSRLASLNQARDESKTAETACNAAERKLKEIRELTDLRRRDYDYFRAKLDLELLQERKDRVDRAREMAAHSQAILATNRVDEEALRAIEAAQAEVITARAKREAKAPAVLLRGLQECRLIKDGTTVKLGQGKELSFQVPDKVNLVVPDKLEMEITAGSSVDTLSKKVEDAEAKLSEVCASLGITGADKAREAFQERQEASRQIAEMRRVEKDNLRDLSYDELAGRLLRLQQTVPAYLPARVSEPSILDSSDLTKTELARLEKKQHGLETEWNEAKAAFDEVKKLCERRNGDYIEARSVWEHQKQHLVGLEKTLEEERATVPDEGVSVALESAVKVLAKAETDVKDAEATLGVLNPEQERELDKTARESLTRIQQQMKKTEKELTEVTTRLKINGEDGLYDKLGVARTALSRAEHENASLAKRAEAANLLYRTMSEERDRARHAYVAPLRERIEALGRLVFDHTFQVEISDDLQIVSRTLNNITVGFDSLSGGTKEQLSLIFRLACAMIVATDGGAPVIVDDTLGYTDPERLSLMGAVLAKAAKECQIVIFTCVPGRYSNIGAAKEIVWAK